MASVQLPRGAAQKATRMSVAVHAPCGDVGQSKSARSPRCFDSSSSGLSLRGRTAQIVNGKLVLVGDGKSSSNEAVDDADDDVEDGGDPLEIPEIAAQSRTDQEAPRASSSRSPTPGSSKARPKPVRRNTRYFCTWEGCSKSYAKPGRLAEHARSHTGERPFKCTQEGCTASYLRDTHLVAHMRTHLDEKDKPFTCSAESCGKKFWTNQHLNRHVKLVHEQDNAYKVAFTPFSCIR